jgi:type II secretory pathway pseudopilin PulG
MIKFNKGAMFGLDARIALAIFGALSVISGAALYSAIQEAKVTAFYAQVKEIEKAFESIYIDLGTLPQHNAGLADVTVNYLNNNLDNLKGWNGPYLQITAPLTTYVGRTSNFVFNGYRMNYSPNIYNTCSNSTTTGGYSASKLYLTVKSKNTNDNCALPWSLLKKIHDKYDDDNNYTDGDIIIIQNSDDTSKGLIEFKMLSNFINRKNNY